MPLNEYTLRNISLISIFNIAPAELPYAIKSFNLILNNGHDTDFSGVVEYLFGNDKEPVGLFQENLRHSGVCRKATAGLSITDLLSEEAGLKNSIQISRVVNGYKNGLIDHINDALIKTAEGWKNSNGNVVLKFDANIDEVKEYLSTRVSIVDSYGIAQLKQAELTGELSGIAGIYARKNDDDTWHDVNSGQHFPSGDIIRLMAHSKNPCIIYGTDISTDYFHANVSNTNKPESNHIYRKSASRQGDCFYATSSINEAVRVYGNPCSHESMGKLLNDQDRAILKKDDYIFGHIYKITTDASVYDAKLESAHIDYYKLPSLHAFMAIANEYSLNQKFTFNTWLEAKSSNCTFTIYMAINKLNNAVIDKGKGNSVLRKLFSSIGFEALNIQFIDESMSRSLKSKINDLEEYEDINPTIKKSLLKKIEAFVSSVKNATPTKGDGGHLIIFNEEMVNKTHLKLLPINNELIGCSDNFYKSEMALSIDEVLNSNNKSDLDILKKYWKLRDNEDMRAPNY